MIVKYKNLVSVYKTFSKTTQQNLFDIVNKSPWVSLCVIIMGEIIAKDKLNIPFFKGGFKYVCVCEHMTVHARRCVCRHDNLCYQGQCHCTCIFILRFYPFIRIQTIRSYIEALANGQG